MVRIGVLTIGSEITEGKVVNTNAAFIGKELGRLGWPVACVLTVGDDEATVEEALRWLIRSSTVIIVTGGLGPTPDDITSRGAARLVQKPLKPNEEALEGIKRRFSQIGREMTESDRKQALIPEGAKVLPNPIGTAPGFRLSYRQSELFFLPGVDREMELMLKERVIPYLIESIGEQQFYEGITLKVFGPTEAQLSEMIADLSTRYRDIRISFLPCFPEVWIHCSKWGDDKDKVSARIRQVTQDLEQRLGMHLFGRDDDTLEGVLGELLLKNGAKISVAESLTGGLIGRRITNIPGSSRYFEGGVISYSNELKLKLLGVDEGLINTEAAVSGEVARAMAEGVRKLTRTTYGLGVTGIAGPEGGSRGKPVGTVFIGLASDKGVEIFHHQFGGGRERIRILTSQVALDTVRRHLLKK